MNNDDLAFAGLVEVAEHIKSRRVSSTEVTKAMLERIEKVDGTYQSYLHVTAEHALAKAAMADVEIGKGIHRGPLHGVPVAVKDLCDTTFAPTTAGTRINSGRMAAEDCTVVSRLQAAGAVILGKLTMTEGAYTSHHPDIPFPPNPWGHDLWVGSSSTGSGVATAAGLCYGSIGSDTGGSIRFPSATCGLTGIKPTWGRVSRHGIAALAESLDHIGPMTRSAIDCGAMLHAIAGWDRKDPTSIDSPVPHYLRRLDAGIRDLRIGFDRRYATEGVDAEVVRALEASIAVFEDLGARIVEVQFPDYKELIATWIMLCSVETAAEHAANYPARSSEYGPELAQLIDEGRRTTGMDVAKANFRRLAFRESLASMFGTIDCMIIPTMPISIPTLERMAEFGEDPAVLTGILRFTAPFDFSGTPTITLPSGMDSRGLPLSMQLIAPRLGEDVLVRAGHAYQTVTDWHRRLPRALAGTANMAEMSHRKMVTA